MTEPVSLPALLREAGAARAGQVALEVHGGARLTYGAWERRSEAQARGLRAAGVRRGDRVALWFDAAHWTDYAVSYIGAQKAGAVAVPLQAGLSANERRRILEDCDAAVLVAEGGAAPATSIATIAPAALEDAAPDGLPTALPHARDTAEILYASGRLTAPLAIARSHASVLAGPSLAFGRAPARPSLAHAFRAGTVAGQDALCACLAPALVRVLVLPAFDADELCGLLAGGSATACALHPALARALIGGAARHDLSRVSGLALSGGPVGAALLTDLAAALPRAALVLSDALGRGAGPRTHFAHQRSRPAALGMPVAGTVVCVVDDAGRPLDGGQVGAVCVRRPPADAPPGTPPRPDGDLVRTGDRGYLDAGHLYVVDGGHDVPRRGASVSRAAHGEPPGELDETVAAILRRVLARGAIEPDEDFFELGGDQAAAVRVIALLEDAFEVRLPVSAFLQAPTVAGVAAAVRRLCADGIRTGRIAVAFAQEGMLWQECFAPGSQNLPGLARRYRGALDTAALRRTLDEIIRRHAALRTTFAIHDGRAEQVVRAHRPLDLPLIDLTTLAPGEQDAEIARLVEDAGRRPFDLVEGPLFAPTLLRLGDADHVLVIRAHHAIFDDWSVGVFRRELVALYGAFAAGDGSPLAEPPLQFADFVRSQRRELAGPAGARQLSFWRRELAGAPFVTQLAVDDPGRPEGSRQTAGEPVSLAVPADLAGALRALARRERTTLYMTMLAAFGVLMARYNDQDDLLLATVVANRNASELEGLIGCFTKKVPLRLRLDGDPSFRDVLARTRRALLGALAHQDLPFEAIVQDVLGAPAAAHGVVPQAAVMFQGVTPRQEITLPGVQTTGFETSDRATRAHFSAADVDPPARPPARAGGAPPWGAGLYLGTFVIVSVVESADGLSCVARGAFHGPAVTALMRSYRTLLAAVVADPARRVSELTILESAQQRELLERGRGPSADPPATTVPGALREQVRRAPAAIAIEGDGESISYAELDARCDRLAGRLRACGVGRGTRVGIALDASADAVVAALAIGRLGAAWVALDPHDAAGRLAWIASDASLRVVLACAGSPALPGDVVVVAAGAAPDPDAATARAPAAVAEPDDEATIFYGSGRSATSPGVVLDHRCVLNLLTGLRAVLPPPTATEPARRVLLCAPWRDGFLRQLAALLDGHRVCAPARRRPADVVALLAADRLDTVDCTPDDLPGLLDAGLRAALQERPTEATEPLLVVGTRVAAGPELWHTLAGLPRVRAHVLYGPPDCSFGATAGAVAATARGVGCALANVACHVLDAEGRPVPARAVGELHLAGASLARGYLGDPDATRPRFVERALAGQVTRLLRTGQLARRLPHGGVELLGPVDGALLRGLRIDTERIRAALRRGPSVRDVTVALEPSGDTDRRLVAHVTPTAAPPALDELRAALWSRLPGYAWPSHATGVNVRHVTEETILAALWAGLLGLERLAPHDNYWQAFSFLDALDRAHAAGVDVPTRDVTANRTLRTLAAAVAGGAAVQA